MKTDRHPLIGVLYLFRPSGYDRRAMAVSVARIPQGEIVKRAARSAVALLLSLCGFSAPCFGQYLTYSIYVDSDDNPTTGCTVALTQSGGTLTGVESVLSVSINPTSPPTVAGVTRSTCTNGSFGPGVSEGAAAYEPGAGAGGADSIELSDGLSALAGPTATKLRLYVVDGSVPGGVAVAGGNVTGNAIADADTLASTTGAGGGAAVLLAVAPTTPVSVPIGWPVMLVLAGLLLGIGARIARRRMLRQMLVALALYSGVAGAAIFNWAGIAPLATDATGDAIGNATILDLHYFYAVLRGSSLYFRIDLAGTAFATVTASGDGNEVIAPSSTTVLNGDTTGGGTFSVIANANYTLSTTVGGTCPAGSWNGSQYTTVPTAGDCSVTFSATLTPIPAMNLTVAGDAIYFNGTTPTSTLSLSGADLSAYPSARFGTVAELIASGTTDVVDSSGNFTLDASSNSNFTSFDFGTGATSGADPVSSTGITYHGVTTYVTSPHGDTVTLSAPAQNVIASDDGLTVNLDTLAYTGTLNFSAGAGGTDTVNATVGGNLGGGTIEGTSSSVAKIALVLSAPGTETLSTAEYNTITSTTGGSITFTGGAFAANTIAFANAGTTTAISNVGNYALSPAGNTLILNNAADTVTGAATGNDAIFLGALNYAGTVAFGAAGSDSIHVTIGGNISGGNVTSAGATVALVLSGAGTETLNTAEYNLFNATSITGGTFGGNTITFSDAGAVTANANIGNYGLAAAGNTITLNNIADNVNGAASGNDTVVIPQFGYSGTLAFGASGNALVEAPTNGDFSGMTLTSAGATLQLAITGVTSGTPSGSTTTTELYNAFTSGAHAAGVAFPPGGDTNPADYRIAFNDQGSVTDSVNIGNYDLDAAAQSTVSDIYTFTVAHNGADVITEHPASTGGSTYNVNVQTFTGSLALGSSGVDTIVVRANGDISSAAISSGGTSAALSIAGSGTVTVSSAQQNLFHDAPSAIAASGTVTMNVADSSHAITLNGQEDALTNVTLLSDNNLVDISVGAATVNSGADGFDKSLIESGSGGNNAFVIDNGGAGATIVNAMDASHFVTIDNFNTTSDAISLTLSNQPQNKGQQTISDSGNDTITVPNNSVIIEEDLGAIPGFRVFNATDLASAEYNMRQALNLANSPSGEYTFVIDSNQGAAIYEIHINNSGAGNIDGIQLVVVVHGVGAFNLVNFIH